MKVDVLFHFILKEVLFEVHFTVELCLQVHRDKEETKCAQTPPASSRSHNKLLMEKQGDKWCLLRCVNERAVFRKLCFSVL